MTVRRAPSFKQLIARLTGNMKSVQPSSEHIIRTELRFLLESDSYEKAIQRLEESPDQIEQLVELLKVRDIEIPGMATLSQLAKRGVDISKAMDALSVRLLSDDLNVSSYSARALTHYHLARGNLEEVDVLFSSGTSSVQYGCAEALRESVLEHNVISTDFAIRKVFSYSSEVQEHAVWALRTSAEIGSDDVRKTISELSAHHIRELKSREHARLDVYRCLLRINELASPKEE
jgi:hypothetical protein